jgi:hypothetical protein
VIGKSSHQKVEVEESPQQIRTEQEQPNSHSTSPPSWSPSCRPPANYSNDRDNIYERAVVHYSMMFNDENTQSCSFMRF